MILNLPESAKIFGWYYPKNTPLMKKDFWELCNRQTRYMKTSDYVKKRKEIHGNDLNASYQDESATAIIRTGCDDQNCFCIKALEIHVNEGCYISGTKDLAKYAVEHEIYECWIIANRIPHNQSIEIAHLLARRYEFKCAVADGNGLRLLNYLTICVSNSSEYDEQVNEFQYAYHLALKRNPVPQLTRTYIDNP